MSWECRASAIKRGTGTPLGAVGRTTIVPGEPLPSGCAGPRHPPVPGMGPDTPGAQVKGMQAPILHDEASAIDDVLSFWFGTPVQHAAQQLEKFRRWYLGSV